MADALRNPSYSTSVGLLRMGLGMDSAVPLAGSAPSGNSPSPAGAIGKVIGGLFKRLLPDDNSRE